MSDFFNRTPLHVSQTYENSEDWRKNVTDFFHEADLRGKQHLSQLETYAQKYKVDLNDGQFAYLKQGIESGLIDEEEVYKQAASMYIGKRTALPSDFVRKNLEYFSTALNIDSKLKTPAGFWQQVINRYKMGDIQIAGNELKYELMHADDPKWRTALQKEINRLELLSEQYYTGEPDTGTAKGKALWALGLIAETAPYIKNMMIRQTAGTVVGSLAGLPFLGGLIGWQYGLEVEGGGLYYELIKQGIDHDIAKGTAMIGGSLSSAVEQLLMGSISKMGKGIYALVKGKPSVSKASNYIVSHVFKDLEPGNAGYGTLTRFVDYILGIPGEGLEEGTQSLTTNIAERVAINIQNARLEGQIDGLPEDEQVVIRALRELQKKPLNEMTQEILDNFIGGAVASIGIGLPGLSFNSMASVREARRLKQSARENTNFNDFEREAIMSPNFEGVQPEKVTESINKIWQEGTQFRRQQEDKRAEELRQKRLYGSLDQSGDPVYRDQANNGLYMEISRHTESNGTITGQFAAGDPRKSEKNSYAIGEYEIRGDTIAITDFKIGEKYEGLQNEILQNFANDMGKEIEYAGQRYAPNGEGRSLRFGWDTPADTAPHAVNMSFNFNRQPYKAADTQADTEAKQNLTNQLKSLDTKISSDAEVNTIVDFYDTVGRKWFGMGFADFMNKMTGSRQQWLHQMDLSDERIARYIAIKENVLTDAAAVQNILENLTDEQREEARSSINGFAETGADGVTKAIHAAKIADVSTFIHEGVHAFTQLARALDPALYRQMMEAAGFNQEEYSRADEAGRQEMTRNAMETLAYGAEAYLKEGPKTVRNSELKNLYDKIKEFLKDLVNAIEKGKFLTPEVRALFDGLFGESGTDAVETHDGQEGSQANDKPMPENEVQKTAKKPQEANKQAAEDDMLFSDSLKRTIKNNNLSDEVRSKAVVRMAGRDYTDALLDERDRGHRPTAELIKRADRIADPALKAKVKAHIRELRNRYAGTDAEYKAPNGKDSHLLSSLGTEKGREAWYAVRLEGFKDWFGDWERTARLTEIEKSPNIVLDGNAYEGKYELNKKSIFNYLENTLRKETMRNPAIIADIHLAGKGIRKLTNWGMMNDTYKKLFAHIPELTKNAIFLSEEKANRSDAHYNKYNHLVCGIEIDNKPHTVHIILGENEGIWYYSHILLDIEKGNLLAKIKEASRPYILESNEGHPESASLSDIKDTTLLRLLQVNSSQVIDENGEPLPVFHGTGTTIAVFNPSFTGIGIDQYGSGFYFTSDRETAEIYETHRNTEGKTKPGGEDNYNTIKAFLSINNPIRITKEQQSLIDVPVTAKQAAAIMAQAPNIYDAEKSPLVDYLDNGGKQFTIRDIQEVSGIYEDKFISLEIDFFKGNATAFRKAVNKVMGYDGVIVEFLNGETHFVAWFSNQIKSATDNIGMFDTREDNIYFQAAFHGSPHRFERFDSAHMGSGEGVQAYGWGHYFASKREIAEWYREKLIDDYLNFDEIIVDGKSITYDELNNLDLWYKLGEYLYNYNLDDVKSFFEENSSTETANVTEKEALMFKKAYEIVKDAQSVKLKYVNPGQLYEVDIPGDEEMLDWDNKLLDSTNYNDKWSYILSDLKEKGKAAGLYLDGIQLGLTGEEIYMHVRQNFIEEKELDYNEAQKQASLLLKEAGFKGIRYLDSSSRVDGEGSHNYVIFDDNDINITQTYYSETFRDAGLSDFMMNYPEVVKEAAQFKNGAQMAEHYAQYHEMPDEVYRKAKALGYFDAIARAAKEGDAEKATNAISGVSAEKAVKALAAYGVDTATAKKAASLVRQDDWQNAVQLLEEHGVPRIDAEVYADTAKMFGKSEMLWFERQSNAEKQTNSKKQNVSHNVEKPGEEKIIKLGKENQAVLKFFNSLVDNSKEVYPQGEENLEGLRMKLDKSERTVKALEEHNAKTFVEMIYTNEGFNKLMEYVYAVHKEGRYQGETDEDTRKIEALYDRVRTTFNTSGNLNWKAAMDNIAAGEQVNPRTKKIIQGMIRNRPLQYMEVWAMMSRDDTWLPEETDLKRIKRLDTLGLIDEEYLEKQSPEELERIARKLSSDRIKRKIVGGTLMLNDPMLNEYEEQLKQDMARFRKLISDREKGFSEYRSYVELAKSNARKHQILLEQEAENTSDEGLKASKERTIELAKAHRQVRDTINEMERFMRDQLLPDARTAFTELNKQLRETERINAELKAINEIREIKKRNLRQILRKPDLKTVSLHEAKYIEWIQAHFDSYEAVARFIGRGAKPVRELFDKFANDTDYRDKLKKKLPEETFRQIERIVYEDVKTRMVRAYGKLDGRQRRVLYKHLTDYQGIFEEFGINILEEPRRFSNAEWNEIRAEMKDIVPADVMQKLEGLLEPETQSEKDNRFTRKFKVENFKIEEIQTLAGVVNKLRKEGREREAARQEARSQLRQEATEKIIKTLEANMPKKAIGSRMAGIASTNVEEEKRSGWRRVWYSLHNARRFFRRLEGGRDGYLNDYITQREYAAFAEENSNVFRRKEKVDKELKEAKIYLKELGRPNRFTLYNGQRISLDEMISFYYAQYNERALHAVMFGNFADQDERDAIEIMANNRDNAGQMIAEAKIALRYREDMKKLDDFLTQKENSKFRQVMEIIGRDYEDNYPRLKEFAAREYNEELGSERYYMPLIRQEAVVKEKNDVDQALADTGLSRNINRGFTKGRVDIPSFAQRPIQAGFYTLWDRMVVKQEHLMAYDPMHRELKKVFESNTLRETLKRGHSEAAVKYIEKFISELATPPVQEDFAALDKINRVMRGHYPAAVLGWRIASIVKQAVESPPPFFQYVNPGEYVKAGISCLRQETRNMIREKSVYMKARYFDPAAAVVREMERMYLTGRLGKAEAVLSKFESTGMKGQTWIDSICVMPGWLASYNRKIAELNKKEKGITVEAAEAKAVKYADQVVRDCQPSSVLMDRIPLLKNNKNAIYGMFTQFQTPIASIAQQLFIDTPNNFKQGRILHGIWTWGIYALLAIVIGAMQEEDDDDDLDPRKRTIDALVMPLDMIPIYGGEIAYAVESFMRDGKARAPRRSNFPVLEQVYKTANSITEEQWSKAANNALKGFMYYGGMPVAAYQDIEKAIETGKPQRIFGIK